MVLKHFLSFLSGPSKTRAWLQPEELTLLLIQLRRHQAKMAGVPSPSDAFTHLQHHQNNDLLGPSMQVRGPRTSLTFSTTHCNPCQCIVVPLFPANPIPCFPVIHKTMQSVDNACCRVYSTILAWLHCTYSRTVKTAFKRYSFYIQCQSFTFFINL